MPPDIYFLHRLHARFSERGFEHFDAQSDAFTGMNEFWALALQPKRGTSSMKALDHCQDATKRANSSVDDANAIVVQAFECRLSVSGTGAT